MPLSAAQGYPILPFGPWLESPPGRYLLEWELAQLDAAVSDVFGFYAMQIGLPEMDALRANRMPFKGCLSEQLPTVKPARSDCSAMVVADFGDLPLDTQSVDLLVLPHTLDCARDPHGVLREAERVLMPEGRLVITGFNPWSLWSTRRPFGGPDHFYPAGVDPLSVSRIKDWLKLLSFEVERAQFGGYVPPCRSDKWLRRFTFMEAAGARWWPFCGSLYMVSAVKRTVGMRMIGPVRKPKKVPRQSAVAVSTPSMHSQQEAPGRKE